MIDFAQILFWLLPSGALLTWVLYYHADIKDSLQDTQSRKFYADRLRRPQVIRAYRKVLLAGLKWVRRFMGKGYLTNRSFGVCVMLSMVYSLALFVLMWLFGGPGAIGPSEFFSVEWPWWQRLLLVLVVAAVTFMTFWVFWRGDSFEEATVRPVRALLGDHLSERTANFVVRIVAGLAMGALLYAISDYRYTLGALLLICLIIGVIRAAWLGAFAAGMFGGAALFGAEGLIEPSLGVQFIMVGVFLGALFGSRIPMGSLAPYLIFVSVLFVGMQVIYRVDGLFHYLSITIILFLVVLPFLNALWDWVSWGISRWLGTEIVRRRSVSRIAGHAVIDVVAALLLLLGLTVTLVIVIEGINVLGQTFANVAPLELDEFLVKAAADPWGPNGLWVTCLLLSTLLPTMTHFLMVIASPLALLPPRRFRHWLADRLAGDPAAHELSEVAWYFALFWPVAGVILVAMFAGVLWVIAEAKEPVSDMLYQLALWTIDVLRLVAQ